MQRNSLLSKDIRAHLIRCTFLRWQRLRESEMYLKKVMDVIKTEWVLLCLKVTFMKRKFNALRDSHSNEFGIKWMSWIFNIQWYVRIIMIIDWLCTL